MAGIFFLTANADAGEFKDTRGAKHMIIPFIGYQTLDGEEVGYIYSDIFYDFLNDTLVDIEAAGSGERNVYVPELGITYRYMPADLLTAELSLSAIHDQDKLEYQIHYEVNEISEKSRISVQRKNTIFTSLSLIVNFRTNVNWLAPSIRLSGGYAWREISVKTHGYRDHASVSDANEFYIVRGGIDLSIWSNNNFLIEGSLYYTQFIPTDSDVDPFGGIGWRIGVFPIWSAKRR